MRLFVAYRRPFRHLRIFGQTRGFGIVQRRRRDDIFQRHYVDGVVLRKRGSSHRRLRMTRSGIRRLRFLALESGGFHRVHRRSTAFGSGGDGELAGGIFRFRLSPRRRDAQLAVEPIRFVRHLRLTFGSVLIGNARHQLNRRRGFPAGFRSARGKFSKRLQYRGRLRNQFRTDARAKDGIGYQRLARSDRPDRRFAVRHRIR